MPPAVALRRRSMSTNAKAVRSMLLQMDPLFRQRTVEGLRDVETGHTIGYDEFRAACEARLADLR